MVIDLADFDNSRYALSTRNSGLPFDGATDLNELLARGAYIRIADDAPTRRTASWSCALQPFLRRATTMTSDPQKNAFDLDYSSRERQFPEASNAR